MNCSAVVGRPQPVSITPNNKVSRVFSRTVQKLVAPGISRRNCDALVCTADLPTEESERRLNNGLTSERWRQEN